MKPVIELGPNFALTSYAAPKLEGITCSLDEIDKFMHERNNLFEYFMIKIYRNPQVRENYSVAKASQTEGMTVYDGTKWIIVPPERAHEVINVMGPIIENFMVDTLSRLAGCG
jgi:hypothetical protein